MCNHDNWYCRVPFNGKRECYYGDPTYEEYPLMKAAQKMFEEKKVSAKKAKSKEESGNE